MKRSILIAAAFGLAASVLAQTRSTIDPTPSGISFRGGVVLPIDDDLRDLGNSWFGFGMDYEFNKRYLKNSDTFISLDMVLHSQDFDKGVYWPLMLNQRFYTGGDELGQNRGYFTVGIGAVFFDVVSSDTRIGAKFGVGKEFGPNIFGEANLFMSRQSSDGINAGSVGFYIGYKF